MKTQIGSVMIQGNTSMGPDNGGTAWRRRSLKGLANLNLAALVVLLLVAVTPTWGQVLPGFLEGALTDLDTVNRTARVNGVLMHIPLETPMASPSVDLNALAAIQGVDPIDLLGGALLPGRIMPGFIGGTCLCATTVDPLTGIVTATDMVLEPSENVVIATVTTHNCVTPSCDPDDDPANELRVGGTLIDPNSDPRLISDPATNRGFEVNLMLGNLVGVGASAEGYMGITDNLHIYVLELDGGVLMNAGMTEVSIIRARCRPRGDVGDWAILGATHDPGTGTVTLLRGDTGAVIGTALVINDPTDPGFGAYLFSEEVTGTCTDSIIADFNGATIIGDVDIRGTLALPTALEPTIETPFEDTLIVQKALFDTRKSQWRVSGTSSVVGPGNTITIYLGSTIGGQILGTTSVDDLGDWNFRDRNSLITPELESTVSMLSTAGGILEGVSLLIK